mgnify:FL=1
MGLILKGQKGKRPGITLARSWVHVDVHPADLPQTVAEPTFTVAGGEVLVHLLYGRVTTVIAASANNLKVTLNPTTGTSGDVASNLDINADEVGTIYVVEGDGTALVGATAGTTWGAAGLPHPFIVNVGTIDIETSASISGRIRWHLFYEPLTEGATVVKASGIE